MSVPNFLMYSVRTMARVRTLVGALGALGVGMVALWVVSQPPAAAPDLQDYVEDEAEFAGYVELPRLGILTSENFVGHRIRVIEGTVRNVSQQTLRSVELNVAFNSFDGDVILESEEQGLQAPLSPGEEQRFTFRFENLPPGWNYRVPDVEIIRIGY